VPSIIPTRMRGLSTAAVVAVTAFGCVHPDTFVRPILVDPICHSGAYAAQRSGEYSHNSLTQHQPSLGPRERPTSSKPQTSPAAGWDWRTSKGRLFALPSTADSIGPHPAPQISGASGRALARPGTSRSISPRCRVWAYINLRRVNAATSPLDNSNHSPFFRFASNRLCQYPSMPAGSSVRIA